MQFWLAKILDLASVCALMRDSSILMYVWSPLAPTQLALLPCFGPARQMITK